MTDQHPIFEEFNRLKDSYGDTISIIDGLPFNQFKTIQRIEFYSNDHYLSGQKDELGRKKPFHNIVNAAVDTATRATDFDTKDITIQADAPQFYAQSMLLSKELFKWMKEARFGETLNDLGETASRYGSCIVKKVKKDGKLDVERVDWRNVFTDQIDIEDGAIAERHYMTQKSMASMRNAWEGLKENWDDVMKLFEESSRQEKSGQGSESSRTEDRVEVIELEGEYPKTYLDENADEFEYSLQRYFFCVGGKQAYILHSEEVKESSYKVYTWKRMAGRALGRGIVEEGFEPQTWVNDSKIKELQVMDLASKMLFKTTDDTIYGNLLTEVENGQVLNLDDGKDISPVNTVSNSIPAYNTNISVWENLFQKNTSTLPAITGEQMPSNTPLGSVQIQNQEARSIFDYRREQKGLFITELIKDWILPHLVKTTAKNHILDAEFTEDELMKIDEAFATKKTNDILVKKILNGDVVTVQDFQDEATKIKGEMAKLGERRFIEIPDNFYKDLNAKVSIVTTNEQFNKQVVLQSLTSIVGLLTPENLQNPVVSKIIFKIVEMSGAGLSPIQLQNLQQATVDQKSLEGAAQASAVTQQEAETETALRDQALA